MLRVYAYTKEPLKIAILKLFIKLQYRTPNLVIGIVNRKSIRDALIVKKFFYLEWYNFRSNNFLFKRTLPSSN
jgi:hypothetical protein